MQPWKFAVISYCIYCPLQPFLSSPFLHYLFQYFCTGDLMREKIRVLSCNIMCNSCQSRLLLFSLASAKHLSNAHCIYPNAPIVRKIMRHLITANSFQIVILAPHCPFSNFCLSFPWKRFLPFSSQSLCIFHSSDANFHNFIPFSLRIFIASSESSFSFSSRGSIFGAPAMSTKCAGDRKSFPISLRCASISFFTSSA